MRHCLHRGIVLIEALNILENIDLDAVDNITRKHLIVEAMRRAYHDRALYLGDADFIDVPVDRLINKHYAQGQSSTIRPDKALASENLTGNTQDKPGGRNTTHFSIIDNEGNRVAATLSINFPFGAGLVANGTGYCLTMKWMILSALKTVAMAMAWLEAMPMQSLGKAHVIQHDTDISGRQ